MSRATSQTPQVPHPRHGHAATTPLPSAAHLQTDSTVTIDVRDNVLSPTDTRTRRGTRERLKASTKSVANRIVGIDLARGFALIGMMAIHVLPMETADDDATWSWLVFSGRSAALFAVIAGISITFMTGGRRVPQGRIFAGSVAALATRAAIITFLGLVLGLLSQDISVILAYYGVMFLLAIPFLKAKPWHLVMLSAFFALASPVALLLFNKVLPMARPEDPDLVYAIQQPGMLVQDLLVTGIYPAMVWMAYLFGGMAIGRLLDTRTPRFAVRTMVNGVILAAGSLWLSNFLLDQIGGVDGLVEKSPTMDEDQVWSALTWGPENRLPGDTWWWLSTHAPHSSTPFDVLHTLGTSLAVLGLCMLLTRSHRRWYKPFVDAGSMPLTCYAAHIVMLVWWNEHTLNGYVNLVLQVAILLVFATLWRRRFNQGPLEKGMAEIAKAVRRRVTGPGQVSSHSAPPSTSIGSTPEHAAH